MKQEFEEVFTPESFLDTNTTRLIKKYIKPEPVIEDKIYIEQENNGDD